LYILIERSNFLREDPDQTIPNRQLNIIYLLYQETLAYVPRFFGDLLFLEMVWEKRGRVEEFIT
jgi:hypothetical protein